MHPSDAAEKAVLQIVLQLVQIARQQEAGILSDSAAEFVHKYRVNLRKGRSLLSLFKQVLSASRYRLLKTALKKFGSASNRLRDLDVFLMHQPELRRMLPAELQDAVLPLFAGVAKQRAEAQMQLSQWLLSDGYLEQASDLRRCLQVPAGQQKQQAGPAIKPLVCTKVRRQYRQVCVAGLAVGSESADETIHKLRIEGKKLRYLLELFAEFFPKDQLKPLLIRLKGLQDSLGRFNDASVQRDFLLQFSAQENLPPDQGVGRNALMVALRRKQLQERQLVEEGLALFAAAPVREQVQRLFIG